MGSRVHNRLVQLMSERHWSDRYLATLAGLSRVRLNRLKNQRAEPTVSDALRLSAALGIRVADLFWLSRRVRFAFRAPEPRRAGAQRPRNGWLP